MADRFDSEEELELSESELFFDSSSHSEQRRELEDPGDVRAEVPSVSPAPERTVSALRPPIELQTRRTADLRDESMAASSSEGPRSPLALPSSALASPEIPAGHKRGCAFGTPEHTPRAGKAELEFQPPVASCPVAIAHFGKKQHVAEPQATENLASPAEHAFMPPHELLAQTLPEYDLDVARLGFRPGSVMEGAGRKLQGRDAVQFRRAIMRQTGFLENQSPLTEDIRFGQSVPG